MMSDNENEFLEKLICSYMRACVLSMCGNVYIMSYLSQIKQKSLKTYSTLRIVVLYKVDRGYKVTQFSRIYYTREYF